MRNEDPIDLTVTLPAGGPLDGAQVRRYLEDELRTRAEVTAADGHVLTVHAYRREEAESVADEVVMKLSKLERSGGCTVSWTDDSGNDVVRSVE